MVAKTDSVSANLTKQNERRERPRFSLNAPLTVLLGDRAISGSTRNLSDRGVYFYVDLPEGHKLDGDFEFVLELPPDVTLSSWCPIRCRARLVRKEQAGGDLAGIAAEILHYSISQESSGTA